MDALHANRCMRIILTAYHTGEHGIAARVIAHLNHEDLVEVLTELLELTTVLIGQDDGLLAVYALAMERQA